MEKSSRGILQEETLKFRQLQDADTAARAGAEAKGACPRLFLFIMRR
jgi:hypothetical protein